MNNRGFTIIEMIVSVAIFSLLVSAGSGIFLSSIKTHRHGLATQEILDQTSYLMEYMSRALRMAKKDTAGSCTGTAKLNYAFENQCIKFMNYRNECQQFCWDGARIKDQDGNYLTSASLNVSSFNVDLSGQYQPPTDSQQPRLTVFLSVEGQEDSIINIQTTISQRNPDVQK